jgi:hypothetical protein
MNRKGTNAHHPQLLYMPHNSYLHVASHLGDCQEPTDKILASALTRPPLGSECVLEVHHRAQLGEY